MGTLNPDRRFDAMKIFLTDLEKQQIAAARQQGDLLVGRFWTALGIRVAQRAASPGLFGVGEDADWWYPAAEYLSDAAMVHAIQPTAPLAAWLRDVSLSVARRPESDWVGPWYRDHATQPACGHLETAHLCWALAAVLDLAPDALTSAEQEEVRQILQEKGITLCRRWLERNEHLANWRSVMVAGMAAAAAVSGERASLEQAAQETRIGAQAFQPDGSYAESLQYANYLAFALMMSHESIRGAAPDLDVAGPEVQARLIPWMVQSMLYARPLSGWDGAPRARAVNFNDCGATFRPSGDLLLFVAARCRDSHPVEAGLARWLFDEYYASVPYQPPHNLASFGLRNDWGFLTLRFLVHGAPAGSPDQSDLPVVAGFSNGNLFIRDRWDGRTVLAVQGGSGPLYGPGHLHGDVNSFQLVHNRQRLLVDPGHSCYRNLIHGIESATRTHNTCTFLLSQDALGLQEDLAKATLLEQSNVFPRRRILDGRVDDPVPPRGRRLLLGRIDEVTAAGSEAGDLYGEPLQEFSRFWLQAGPHVLFVVDRIVASRPVTTIWNWLFNHRDDNSTITVADAHTIVMRRGLAGLRLTHLADGQLSGPVFAFVHDAYHPEPQRLGEGRSGSGRLYRWIEPAPRAYRLAVHAIAVDDYGLIDRWTAERTGEATYKVSRDNARWTLEIVREMPLTLVLGSEHDGRRWELTERNGEYNFLRILGESPS